jgi:hypothetical protein
MEIREIIKKINSMPLPKRPKRIREDPKSLLRYLERAKKEAIEVEGASGTKYLMSPLLIKNIYYKQQHMKQNDDSLTTWVGMERAGKSVLCDQVGDFRAKLNNTNFTIDNIHFTYKSYMKFAQNTRKLTTVRHDEARHDINKFRRLSTSNVIFNNYLSECGEDNINHDVVLPRFSDLDPGVSIDRCSMIVKVYKFVHPEDPKKIVRGLYSIWSTKNKDLLLDATKNNSNLFPSAMFVGFGYFEGKTCIPEKDYTKKKKENRKKKYEEIEAGGNVPMLQRDILFTILNKDEALTEIIGRKIEKKNKNKLLSTREISELLKKYGQDIAHNTISIAINNLTREK